MNAVDETSPAAERRYHQYSSNVIPWFVRLMWLGFWSFAIYYTVQYLLPALQREIITPP